MRGHARPGRHGGFWARIAGWLLRRCWPALALLAAGLVVQQSTALQGLLMAAIGASWALLALLGLRAAGARVPASARTWARSAAAAAAAPAARAARAAGLAVAVQARRLRSRITRPERMGVRS